MKDISLNEIEKIIEEEFSGFYLTDEERAELVNTVAFHTINQEKFPGSHRNLLLVYEDEYRLNSFVEKMVTVIERIIGTKNIGRKIEESTLSKRPEFLKNDGSNKKIYVITGCIETEPENWMQIRKAYESNPKDLKIICVTKEAEFRLKKDEHVYYRVFNKRLPLRDYSWEDAYISLMDKIKKNDYHMECSEEFCNGIREYIKAVYDGADLKRQVFVDDVYDRIVNTIDAKEFAEEGITLYEKHVPYYRKKTVDNLEALAQIEKDADEYIFDKYQNFFSQVDSEKEDGSEINICLMALSDMGSVAYGKRSTLKSDDNNITYYYQQEAALLDLKNKLQGRTLDHFVVMTTQKTRTCGNKPVYFETKDKMQYVVNESALSFVSKIVSTLWNAAEIKNIAVDEEGLNTSEYVINKSSTAKAVRDAFAEIKKIENLAKKEGKKVVLHYYNNGAFREIAVVLESILSLIENDEKLKITINNCKVRYERSDDPDNKPTTTINVGELGIFDFVSGINEVLKYGKTDSLKNYFRKQKIDRESRDYKFVYCLDHISKGIQVNDLEMFLNGLEDLKKIKKTDDISSVDASLNDPYLDLLRDSIIGSFGFLDKTGDDYLIGIMNWCLDRGYYQQLLTMIESLVPEMLYKKDIYDISEPAKREIESSNEKFKDESVELFAFNKVICGALRKVINKKNYGDEFAIKGLKFQYRDIEKEKETACLLKRHARLKDKRNESSHLQIKEGKLNRFDDDRKKAETLKGQLTEYVRQLEKVIGMDMKGVLEKRKEKALLHVRTEEE